jgi:putative aminopeptidase FrvX
MMPAGKTLAGVERAISRDLKPDSFALEGWTAAVDIKRGPTVTPLKNVIGVLEGKGPLANQTVIVGAHYDHLGYGNPDQSLWKSNRRAIFHGADDNASGVAGILELARRFREAPDRAGRRLVFIAFSGEELGMKGSEYYCKNPAFPIADTATMFNLDMIGRLSKETLWTEGHGTARPFREMLENGAKKHGLKLRMQESGYGPSDHASFVDSKVRVPVMFLWTGDQHPDYHRPTDTADKVDYANARRIVDLGEELITALTTVERPAFQVVRGDPVKPSTGPRLGLRLADGKEGAEVQTVTLGGAADRAGIKPGDAIVAIGATAVRDLKQYVQAMAAQRHGATIEVTLLRDGKRMAVKVTLD